MTYTTAIALTGSLVLTAFHALAAPMARLPARYVTTFRSAAGGAGLAYVFLYLLFQLATEGAPKIHALLPLGPAPLETVFVLILLALSATYLVQMEVERTPGSHDDHGWYFVLFLIYNVLAGAGVAEEAVWGTLNLAFYVAAIGIHLLFNELFLLHRCPDDHTMPWRIALGVAPIFGCALAMDAGIPDGAHYIALAFVAGGTIPIAFQRELPQRHAFRPLAFIVGVLAYGALIYATWRF